MISPHWLIALPLGSLSWPLTGHHSLYSHEPNQGMDAGGQVRARCLIEILILQAVWLCCALVSLFAE